MVKLLFTLRAKFFFSAIQWKTAKFTDKLSLERLDSLIDKLSLNVSLKFKSSSNFISIESKRKVSK